MANAVVMPKLGLTMKMGTVAAWLVPEGAQVKKGDRLFTVETEKVNLEVGADQDGILHIVEPASVKVAPGTLIAYLLDEGEAAPATPPAAPAGMPEKAVGPTADVAAAGSQRDVRAPSSPLARRVANELGVDLSTVTGSGPRGRITEQDVRSAADAGSSEAPGVGAASESADVRPLSAMRRVIAERMVASLAGTAQLSMGSEASADALLELRRALLDAHGDDSAVRPTVTDLVLRAVALALRDHPNLNVRMTEDGIAYEGPINLGFAVALPDGLVVPVIRDADQLGILGLAQRRADLAARAQDGLLGPDDLTGSTFTVSSLGNSGIRWFTPILNPPEAGILGVGSIYTAVEWRESSPVPAERLPLSLTVDHRLVDGAPAAGFLQSVVGLLERPMRLPT